MKKTRTAKQTLWLVILSLAVIYLQHFQLNYSASIGLMDNLTVGVPYQLLGMAIVSLPFLLFLILSGHAVFSLVCSGVLATLLSFANYYTYLYHGSPALASDFYSLSTALNVLSEYSFKPDGFVLRLAAVFVLELILILILKRILGKSGSSLPRTGAFAALFAELVLLWFVFFSPWTLFPKNLVTFSWTTSFREYGYETCFANSIYSLSHKFIRPEGYSADLISTDDIETEKDSTLSEYPDIVVILNETLCNLDYCIDVPEGKEALRAIDEIDGIISGYSVASLVGGGTNNSEYELLTSNSMELFAVSAPFQIMDLRNANSLVSYLEKLGYYTAGMHCGSPTNYARSRAYSQLGFDDVYLGSDSFTKNYYGSRPWRDIDNYRDMTGYYEAAPDQPRFMYLLSFQNHGGYEQNDPEMDTVSVAGDYGEYTDDITEFLTSIEMSAQAFRDLCAYYENQDRPAIILMVGDHAPAFISSLSYRDGLNETEKKIADRVVPYYVWSNIGLDRNLFPEYTSMVDLVPLILNASGMPMSPYYSEIVKLNEELPVRTADAYYLDREGRTGLIDEDAGYSELIRNYRYMEYNNLIKGNDYRRELFETE